MTTIEIVNITPIESIAEETHRKITVLNDRIVQSFMNYCLDQY